MAEPAGGPETHEAIAAELFRAYRDADPIAPPRERYDLSIADGYAIADQVLDRRSERGDEGEVVGYKIGFTNEVVRKELGVSEPAFGRVLDGTVLSEGVIDAGALVAPRIEPEIVFVTGERIDEPHTVRKSLDAIDEVRPAIEVVDCRIRGWDLTAPEAVADNALAARLRVGEPHTEPARPSAETDGASERVVVEKNGEEVATGVGNAVLGHPVRALAWLTDALAARGEALAPGTLVSTGSITRPIPVVEDDEVVVRFDTLGGLELRVA